MFEVPEAKRVRRADLNACDDHARGDSDESHDLELQAKLNAQIASALGLDQMEYEPIDVSSMESKGQLSSDQMAEAEEVSGGSGEQANHEEFAFRLFNTTKATPKVVLEDETELKGDGGLVKGRPLEYYLVTNVAPAQKAEFQFAAVSCHDVLQRSKTRSRGLELPWKVTHVGVVRKGKSSQPTVLSSTLEDDVEQTKRKRPGKKQRIILRQRAKAQAEKETTLAQKQQDKEEQIKDKKKRLNRLKKLRRRAKGKESKQAQLGGEGSDESDDGADAE